MDAYIIHCDTYYELNEVMYEEFTDEDCEYEYYDWVGGKKDEQ